ncbi:AfsR/SARP family transcriptional regulator [Actinomadura rayongensis]|uniref:OmpR/PhoB-type domain-containing protein n=1 Tax=Actinomadura rayongensis TaxID=1429076 RepID=A0A6I4W3X2_9ACTN|nr:BTAD domain-containing putative transcriptional regulator [Actinomadura rayongensis]MXQ64867.1 hypothetical protein [Actinomadura rayongensis]
MSSELVASTEDVTVHVVNTIELRRGGTPIRIGASKHQAIFAYLAIAEGSRISRGELVERVWDGEEIPLWADADLQRKARDIKKVLAGAGFDGSLTHVAKGYRLELPPSAVDFLRFRTLVSEAGGHADRDPGLAADLVQQALDLVAGRPLPGLGGAKAEAFRQGLVEERRLAGLKLERWSLEAGRARERLPMLQQARAEHPDDQELARYLMNALAAVGRPGEALSVYDQVVARFPRGKASIDPKLTAVRDRIRDGAVRVGSAEPGSADETPEGGDGVPEADAPGSESPRRSRSGESHHHEYHRIDISDGGVGQFGIVNNWSR